MKQDLSEEGDAEEDQDGTVQSSEASGALAIRRGSSKFGMSRGVREILITDGALRQASLHLHVVGSGLIWDYLAIQQINSSVPDSDNVSLGLQASPTPKCWLPHHLCHVRVSWR